LASESFGLLGALGVFCITNKRALLSKMRRISSNDGKRRSVSIPPRHPCFPLNIARRRVIVRHIEIKWHVCKLLEHCSCPLLFAFRVVSRRQVHAGVRAFVRAHPDDDHPFIVLTETKFSFRCIPVGIGSLLTGLGLKKKAHVMMLSP